MRAPTLAALIAYHGHRFHGFQRQGELPTVEGALRAAIEAATGAAPIGLVPASRTDAGVHAAGQLVSFRLADPPPAAPLRTHINAALPPGIYLRDLWRAHDRFNARAQALEKRYRYLIDTRGGEGPAAETCLRMEEPLDLGQMRAAAALLSGKHDFTSFRASGCRARSPICELTSIRVAACDHLIAVEVVGDRFLRRMVRNIVGLMIAIGGGVRATREISEILAARSRAAAAGTAPARGLTLLAVSYGPECLRAGGAGDGSCG